MQTLEAVPSIAALLGRLAPGAPLAHEAVTVVPLLAGTEAEPGWLTLADAGEAVTVGEVSEAGSVPNLTVTNRSDRAVLLLDGEELIGAKQNRVLNTTVLVAAHATLTIPVSCVEEGRWGYQSQRFEASGASLFAGVRAQKAAQVTASLRRRRQHVSDQSQIWRDVAAKLSASGARSATGAMRDFYAHHAPDLDAGRQALAARPGQVGALVFLGDRWLGLDLLASPGLFGRAWPRLCAGYVAEAVGRDAPPAPAPKPEEVLAALRTAPAEQAPAVGLGAELRIAAPGMSGAALVAEDRVAHLMAFALGAN